MCNVVLRHTFNRSSIGLTNGIDLEEGDTSFFNFLVRSFWQTFVENSLPGNTYLAITTHSLRIFSHLTNGGVYFRSHHGPIMIPYYIFPGFWNASRLVTVLINVWCYPIVLIYIRSWSPITYLFDSLSSSWAATQRSMSVCVRRINRVLVDGYRDY